MLFFGDSLVAGVGDPIGAGWVGRTVAASFEADLPITAYNLGIRGETSEQIASRWRAEALPRLLPEMDSRIVLSFGANDTTIEGDRMRVEAGRSAGTLAAILDEAAMLGLQAFVVGPAPVDDPEQNRSIRSLSLLHGGVCAEHEVPFVSVIEALLTSEDTDLILMDVMMPELDGYATMTRIRQMPAFVTLPIIAVTARAMPGDKEKSIAAGASDHVTKPVDTDELLACMERWLTHR